MKNTKVIEIIQEVENYLEREEYLELFDYIQDVKKEIAVDQDPASKYIDELVSDLK